jgi:hypothetical protein
MYADDWIAGWKGGVTLEVIVDDGVSRMMCTVVACDAVAVVLERLYVCRRRIYDDR